MDYGHKQTDKLLKELETEITDVYAQAQKDAYNKAADYFKRFMNKDREMNERLSKGEITEKQYKEWRVNKMTVGARYKAMEEGLAQDMTNSNKLAASMINGHLPDVYATNYNWATYQIEQDSRMDTNFMIYDRQTVERLIRDKPDLLPMKAAVSVPDDIRWNKKHINNAVTQGILLGESIPDIAKRLAGVTDMNRKAAIRNARTMTTSAENGGRIDSYKRAIDMGIKITQKWLATKDNRTRHEHAMLDGQEAEVGKPFKVEGYEIAFPGDPTAEPFLVYNCRCALASDFKGFDYKKMDAYTEAKPMSYSEWEKKHEVEQKPQAPKLPRPAGKTGWAYNTADGYKSKEKAIEDINAIVDNAPIEMQKLWEKNAPDLQPAISEKEGEAYFKHSDKRVYFNGKQVQEGDVCHVPYQNHFHEFLHNIDYLNRDKEGHRMYFSDSWTNSKGETLEMIIMDEWKKKFGKLRDDAEIISKHVADLITGNTQSDKDHMHGVLKRSLMSYRKANGIDRDDARYQTPYSELKECETLKQYLDFYKKYSSILISDDVRRDYGYAVDKDAVKGYIKEMREKYSLRDRGNLSDMMQKFTVKELDLDHPLGCGHRKTYFNTEGYLSNEAFAEMGDSTFTNPAALELIKQELPDTYSAWQQMINELIGGNTDE